MLDRIGADRQDLDRFCQRWKIESLSLFGSVLREDFDEESDVDVLATFEDDAEWSLLDHVRMERELAEIVGREVDLLNREVVDGSDNWIRRRSILENTEPLYARG